VIIRAAGARSLRTHRPDGRDGTPLGSGQRGMRYRWEVAFDTIGGVDCRLPVPGQRGTCVGLAVRAEIARSGLVHADGIARAARAPRWCDPTGGSIGRRGGDRGSWRTVDNQLQDAAPRPPSFPPSLWYGGRPLLRCQCLPPLNLLTSHGTRADPTDRVGHR
jgi:hypothetical protein